MTGPHKTPDIPHHGHHDRPGLQQGHDPYLARQKLPCLLYTTDAADEL